PGPSPPRSAVAGATRATNPAGAFWIWTFTPRTVVAAMAGAIWTATRTRAARVNSGGNTTPTSRTTSWVAPVIITGWVRTVSISISCSGRPVIAMVGGVTRTPRTL